MASLVWIFILFVSCSGLKKKHLDVLPTLNENDGNNELLMSEGDDGLLTCIVRNLGDYSLLWKVNDSAILSIDDNVLTDNKRISIIHDEGGDVFVLSINNLKASDQGLYSCEVNSRPVFKSYYKLRISSSKSNSSFQRNETHISPGNSHHDYTDCCIEKNVTSNCQIYCNINNILEGITTVNPAVCESQFTQIVECMADGRNHVPCCSQANIPTICQDMCYGQYTVQTDDIRSHIYCSMYTTQTLACISEGINILPERPRDLKTSEVGDESIKISWSRSKTLNAPPTEFIQVNVTQIKVMIPESSELSLKSNSVIQLFNITGNNTDYEIKNLTSFTYYYVSLSAFNKHGSSLPTYTLKVLTKEKGKNFNRNLSIQNIPKIPDSMKCCKEQNITHNECLNNFCDAHSLKKHIDVPTMMICAPWMSAMLNCVTDGRDHSSCCLNRQVPSICLDFCAGKHVVVDYRHFKCLEYFDELSSCSLTSLNALPSQPINFRFTNIGHNLGVLHWNTPDVNGDSVLSYTIHYSRIYWTRDPETVIPNIESSPFVLENLAPNSSYEVYVTAENKYGIGEASTRIVFRTASDSSNEDLKESYDMTSCCLNAHVSPLCSNLCAYNASMTELKRLTNLCRDDWPKLIKCAVGGRNHVPCCSRRAVPESCLSICQGIQPSSSFLSYKNCLPYIGNIMTCLEEGVLSLPSPIINFHVLFVHDDKVTLTWSKSPTFENVTHYIIYYAEKSENNTNFQGLLSTESFINITDSSVIISHLKTKQFHQFYVIAENEFGTSLPSSIISVNVSNDWWSTVGGQPVEGQPSPPHSVEITSSTANSVSLAWSAPAISNPEASFEYVIHYKTLTGSLEESSYNNITTVKTVANSIELRNLKPNSQYIFYLTALAGQIESLPSETILVWTDPIIPAFAESPAIYHDGHLVEGSSMTILCIALGSPIPTLTLYVGGHLVRSSTTRHMVTNIKNISREMSLIGCHANNNYSTPMIATKFIQMERKPILVKMKDVFISEGQNTTIKCLIDAYPTPTLSIGRSSETLSMKNRHIHASTDPNTKMYQIEMVLENISSNDDGVYFCRANNSHGLAREEFQVHVLTKPSISLPSFSSLTHCCQNLNVSLSCLPICSLDNHIDLDFLLYQSECFSEFHKVMQCASNGSDYTGCCTSVGVPRFCLDWCRGIPIENEELCALSHARSIVNCFSEPLDFYPPKNLKVKPLSATTVLVEWEPPSKQNVEMYRLMWKEMNSRYIYTLDTSEKSSKLANLRPGVKYELRVKAGNSKGSSPLSSPLIFFTADEFLIASQEVYSNDSVIISTVLVIVFIIIISGIAYWFVRNKNKLISGSSSPQIPSRTFENPFFNREVSMSHLENTEFNFDETPGDNRANSEDTSSGFKFKRLK